MSNTLLIRADASPQIGTDHVMRCLALAQVWQKSGGAVLFLGIPLLPGLKQRLMTEKVEMAEFSQPPRSAIDAATTIALARGRKVEAVVVDGYQFDGDYQQRLKDAGLRVLWMDDYGHAPRYVADFVLNQNLGASEALYADHAPRVGLLLGPRYLLLRQDFQQWQNWKRVIHTQAKRFLVTLGGTDVGNVTLKILQALPKNSGFEVTALTGASNPNLEALRSYCSVHRQRLIVDATNLPELMAEADLAITAGGTTLWELPFMGLPALLVTLANNQAASVENAVAAGIARSLGRPEEFTAKTIVRAITELSADSAARREMSKRGRTLIDGEGAFRVWLHLKEASLHLSQATHKESRLLWEWANEPGVRAVSFASEAIPWEDHAAWLEKRLADANTHLWIARDNDNQPVGQARFDVAGRSAAISVSLDKNQRGENRGALLIWLACRKLLRETPVEIIEALIKTDNDASRWAFQKVGFEKSGTKEVNGYAALVFTLTKDRAER